MSSTVLGRRHWIPLIVLLNFVVASADPPPAPAPAAAPAGPSFTREWETTYGLMTLKQSGSIIDGAYGRDQSTLKGEIAASKFTFTYTEPNAAGEGWFELAPDGATFSGQWRENGAAAWSPWTGKRRAGPPPPADNFTGLWKTTYGRMRLHQTGNAVHGVYDFSGGSTVSGIVEGRALKFSYDQPDGERGSGVFELAADAKSFAGTWQGDKAGAAASGAWSGTRVVPVPGRTWLVVLEANWERDLEEEEYSFGVMLRTFFARVPQVRVRHRFFGDEAEFRRWCAELRYIAEPVVLHISSHGDKDGVHCRDGKTIGAKAIAECLRDIGDLRLLHFGTCLIAGGDIPRQIQAELGPDAARFPISGYANAADWGGSAIVDFTYLDLILARGLSPADAVRQTTRMLSFAGSKQHDGDAIAPAGLVILEPRIPEPAPQPDKPK
jgi:hypothetical protein